MLKTIYLFVFILNSCSFIPKNLDRNEDFTTKKGFRFSFDIPGKWHPVQQIEDDYFIAKKDLEKEHSILGIVKEGSFGKKINKDEALKMLEEDLRQAENEKIAQVQSHFEVIEFKKTYCLYFAQQGLDHLPTGTIKVQFLGVACLHPKRPSDFLLMAFNERTPIDQKFKSLVKYLEALKSGFSYF